MSGEVILGLIFISLWLLCAFIFIIPSIIAFRRDHPNRWLILAVNVFLGGTGIGWGVALVWALRIIHLPGDEAGSRGGQSGLNIFANDPKRVIVDPPMFATRPTGQPSFSSDAMHQIERLVQLRTEGHIGDAEFAQLKAAVISRTSQTGAE